MYPFMALLPFVASAPELAAQGEQRRPPLFQHVLYNSLGLRGADMLALSSAA
jgi:hypothetical protein